MEPYYPSLSETIEARTAKEALRIVLQNALTERVKESKITRVQLSDPDTSNLGFLDTDEYKMIDYYVFDMESGTVERFLAGGESI